MWPHSHKRPLGASATNVPPGPPASPGGLIRTPRTPRRRKSLLASGGSTGTPGGKRIRGSPLITSPPRSRPRKKIPGTPQSGVLSPVRASSAEHLTPPATPGSDRFIPPRSSNDPERSFYSLHRSGNKAYGNEDATDAGGRREHRDCEQRSMQERFQSALRETLLDIDGACGGIENADPNPGAGKSPANGGGGPATRVLDFSGRSHAGGPDPYRSALQVLPQAASSSGVPGSPVPSRHISPTPTRILDAPDLVDDYYLNLIHWGSRNVLAVALGSSVYLWNASSCTINHLVQLEGPSDFVTSVNWSPDGRSLAVGCSSSAVRIYDAEALSLTQTLRGHVARVGSLSWLGDLGLTSGSRDAAILHRDLRQANRDGVVARLEGHTQEVCGLRWNADTQTLASGGNENYLCLWDARSSAQRAAGAAHAPRLVLAQHQAAVKALAWAPFSRHVLASGGGTADRSIKIWNASTGACQQSVDTGSQVCALLWSPHARELCSSHGFSEHQLVLWRFPSMQRLKELKGHTARVLHMSVSPDGRTVISAAADETLRFWEIFGAAPASPRRLSGDFGSMLTLR